MYLMGVDLGSSAAKARIIDRSGATVGFASQDYPIAHPRPGWVEVDPEDWFAAASGAIRRGLEVSGIDPEEIAAVACVGPAHNVALLEDGYSVVAPTLHWSDLRSSRQAADLEASAGEEIFTATMQPANPSWTLAQLRWLSEERPHVLARVRHILVAKDYVRHRLTGDNLTDRYDAIGTQLFDVGAGAWSDDLCSLAGIDPAVLPDVAESSDVAGKVTDRAARATGLLAGTPVVVGGGDSSVEAAGVGASHPGDMVINLGTAAAVSVVTDGYRPSRQTITYSHVVGDLGFSLCATNAGSGSLRWFREQLTYPDRSFAELVDLAGTVGPGAGGLLFHPFLNGERSPYWDPRLRADFLGISSDHRFEHFTRAVLEGVAFSIRECVDVLDGLGENTGDAVIIGGGSRSDVWAQIVSDITGRRLGRPDVGDATVGAALLGGIGVEVFHGWPDALDRELFSWDRFEPDPASRNLYEDLLKIYRDAVAAVRDTSHRLTRLADST